MCILLRLLLTALYTIYYINKVFVVYKFEKRKAPSMFHLKLGLLYNYIDIYNICIDSIRE